MNEGVGTAGGCIASFFSLCTTAAQILYVDVYWILTEYLEPFSASSSKTLICGRVAGAGRARSGQVRTRRGDNQREAARGKGHAPATWGRTSRGR